MYDLHETLFNDGILNYKILIKKCFYFILDVLNLIWAQNFFFRMTLLTRSLRMTYIYMSKSSILTLFTLKFFRKSCENKSSLSACAFERRGFKLSKNGFRFFLSLKLRELEHFQIFKIFGENCRFSKNTAAGNVLTDPDPKKIFPKSVSTSSLMS